MLKITLVLILTLLVCVGCGQGVQHKKNLDEVAEICEEKSGVMTVAYSYSILGGEFRAECSYDTNEGRY